MTARIDPCGICGNIHSLGDASAMIGHYRDKLTRLGSHSLPPEDVEDILNISRCLHSQLYAAHADQHNYALTIRDLQADNNFLRHGVAPPSGTLLHSDTEYAVRRRDGSASQVHDLDFAVRRFDAWNRQAEVMGFESAEAEVVSRERATYVRAWAPVPADEIAAARARNAQEADAEEGDA